MGTVLTRARCVKSGEAMSCQAGSRHGRDNMCAVVTQASWGLRLCHLKLLVSNIRRRYSYSKLERERGAFLPLHTQPNICFCSCKCLPTVLLPHSCLLRQSNIPCSFQATSAPNHEGFVSHSEGKAEPAWVGGCQPWVPVEDGAHAGAVGTAAVHMQPRGQQDPILDRHRTMGERGNQQLIPACKHRGAGHVRQSGQKSVPHGAAELVSPR